MTLKLLLGYPIAKSLARSLESCEGGRVEHGSVFGRNITPLPTTCGRMVTRTPVAFVAGAHFVVLRLSVICRITTPLVTSANLHHPWKCIFVLSLLVACLIEVHLPTLGSCALSTACFCCRRPFGKEEDQSSPARLFCGVVAGTCC